MLSPLDTRYSVETPEGIDLQVQLAGPVPRILAYSIDASIRLVCIVVISIIFSFIGNIGIGLILLASFLLEWFYPVLFEVYKQGQTPGKKCLGLAVVNDDLTPVNWNTSLIRNLLRATDFLPSAYIGGVLCMIISKNFQRLGDLAAGTLVVHTESQLKLTSLPETPAQLPSIPLTNEDQAALVSFTQRHNQLTHSRQQELANILSNVTGKKDETAIQHIQGIGIWLLGDKH